MWYAIISARLENYYNETFKKTAIFTWPNNIIRTWAEGQTLEVPIEGFGKVAISKPREASTKTVLELVKEKIDKNQELKNAMISKGILREIEQKTPAAKASITIKSNI